MGAVGVEEGEALVLLRPGHAQRPVRARVPPPGAVHVQDSGDGQDRCVRGKHSVDRPQVPGERCGSRITFGCRPSKWGAGSVLVVAVCADEFLEEVLRGDDADDGGVGAGDGGEVAAGCGHGGHVVHTFEGGLPVRWAPFAVDYRWPAT